jgi:NADH-quinone oxidoreductase subunit H
MGLSAVMAALFLGGWWTFGLQEFVPGWLLFIAKIYAVYFLLIWFRGTLPRFRIDQLMAFAWKFLLPLALVNVLLSAFEILIWEERGLSAGVVLPIFAVVNVVLAGVLVTGWARVMTRSFEAVPRRPKLFKDIAVPLPAEPVAQPTA